MTDNLSNEEYIPILNGYSFEYRFSEKKPRLIRLGFYDSRDKRLYESDDLTVFFCLAFFAKRTEKLLPEISSDWWDTIEAHYGLPIYSENLPETDQFKAFVKRVEVPNKNENWFPAKLHLLTTKGTYFRMDICNVLKQVRELTSSTETAFPEIYSDELSEDDWWHKAMGCHFHACPYGSHCC